MPLIPLDECGNVDPIEDGCEVLWDLGEAILESAWSGLLPYAPPDGSPCFPGVLRYVSMTAPPADLCDLLAVYLVSYGPNAQSQNVLLRSAGAGMLPEMEAVWSVDLWEARYPTVEEQDERFIVPSPDELHEVNEHVYRHGLAAFTAVSTDYEKGTFGRCSKILFGPLIPLAPEGGCVGWRFTLTTGF